MGYDSGPVPKVVPEDDGGNGYALTGKIMLSAIVILLFVVILMVSLHLYARWYLIRTRRRQIRRNRYRHRRTQLVFYVDPNAQAGAATVTQPTHGLDASVLMLLPVFVYSSKTHPDPQECAVCLSEFEENEKGRILPNCNHSFHIQCIDMWFHSHSTCPLCRSPVEPYPVPHDSVPVHDGDSVAVEPGSSSELCATCQHEGEPASGPSTSSFGERRKRMDVRIEIPTRNASFGGESGTGSPASQSFRSPMSRMLSFTRILSRDRRLGLSPSASCVGNTVDESDIERGREESQQGQS
ncbi:RING-H2 finger protein ATL2 [Tripterygium wilfordii]|uniref:RING-type E3 ubiquitin transferase n=1 Tax=Tripterygium wilfordii TaxID=458696 RepID=A0A7J7CSG6_TRIWF|nr:RING-H2 finger protein ATL2-like [Tripterygium wilfordii]KAF5737011.1 RING-H2 finger protein ATL2 [Tripterygium wilfordii]